MTIRIIEGKPGSGKTYYAVHHLAKTFFNIDGAGVYALIKDVTLITNIDSFVPAHLSLDKLIKENGGVSKFFSYEFQDEFRKDKPTIVYIIDEAQRFFRKNDKTLTEVFTWLEYHRHWGQDVYLVTQNSKKLPFDITTLVEFIIRARPRSRSLTGGFKFGWMSDNEQMKTESLKPDQSIFALYKSMDVEETEKVKNPMLPRIIGTFVVSGCLIGGAYYYATQTWGKGLSEKHDETVSSSKKNFTVSGDKTGGQEVVKTDRIVLKRLSVITKYTGKRTRVTVIFNGEMIPLEIFPHPIKTIAGAFYASVPESFIKEDKEVLKGEGRSDLSVGRRPQGT